VTAEPPPSTEGAPAASLTDVIREWGRIGCVGFGGPPTHIALLRDLCVRRRAWLSDEEFEDAIAACNLLPGPASTQLAILCAWRVRGRVGAVVGGLAFIVPGLVLILGLASVVFASSLPRVVQGAGAGAGAAVAAVAVHAGLDLLHASRRRAPQGGMQWWVFYVAVGVIAAAAFGPWVVVVLLGCGAIELTRRAIGTDGTRLRGLVLVPTLAIATAGTGGLLSLSWVAFKVGALSYGGGFVIVPLMQAEAVGRYGWMTAGQFLNAVALGQVTPGPVVLTVAAVGYAAGGLAGGLLAAVVAFSPSFAFVLIGGHRFDRLRNDRRARAFLAGAGPAAVGAILGSAIPLTRALTETWQYAVLAIAAVLVLALRRSIVTTIVAAAALGSLVALAGGPMPR
jgi:chromate transporter